MTYLLGQVLGFRTRLFVPLAYLLFLAVAIGSRPAVAQESPQTEQASETRKPITTDEVAAEEESSREALLVYAEAAGFQNNKQFDLASVEWRKFLDKHASDPKALEARYNLAICQLQETKFEDAIANLEIVTTSAGKDFERLQDAYLNLGWGQYSLGLENQPTLFAKASETFGKLLSDWPEGEFRDQALFFGGESLYLQGRREEAVASYAELVEKHANSELRSDAMYALGVTYEDLRQFDKAKAIFEAFLSSFPNHDLGLEVKMRKAETLLQGGDFKAAETLFGEVANSEGFRATDHARYRQAVCVAQQGEYALAGKLFAEVAQQSESSYAADAAIAAGRSYYRAKEFDSAKEWFERVEASDSPHVPEAVHWHARILLEQDKHAEARALVVSVLEKASEHPFWVSLKLDGADALYEMVGTRKEAVQTYFKIFQDHAEHRLAPKALYNAAYGAMEEGDYRNGLAYANEFSSRFQDHSLSKEIQKVVAECNLQLGQHEEAAATYEKLAAEGDQDGTRFELRRGLSLFLEKQYDKSIEVLKKVYGGTESADEKAESAYWLGRNFYANKQDEQAIQAFQASLKDKPDWRQADEVLLNLSRALKRAEQSEEATLTLTKLIASYPNSEVLDQAHYRLAEFHYASNEYLEAAKSYAQVLERWPTSKLVPYALYGRGWSRLRAGDAKGASQDFDLLLKEHADHDLANQTVYAAGMSAHQSGDQKQALAFAQKYLETKPTGSGRSDGLYLQGLCYAGLDQRENAIATFEQLAKSDPNYVSIDKTLYELAWAHKNNGAEAPALETFLQLIERAPKSPLAAEAQYHLGEDAYGKKEYAQSKERYLAARTLAQTSDLAEKVNYKLGWSYYQLGNFSESLAAFDQQLAINDNSNLAADAQFLRGECYFKLEEYDKAFQAYTQAQAKPSKNETMQVLTYLHGGQAAGQQKDWKVSAEWTSELLKKFPKTPYAPQAKYELAWAQRNLGQLDTALQFFNDVSADSQNELGARARFMAGEVLFQKKEFDAAILEFRRVMFGYGADRAPDGVKTWQAKSAFEAGRCASVLASSEANPQRKAQLVDGAREFFQYVADKHPRSDEADAAKQQLQRMATRRVSRSTGAAGAAAGR